MERLSSILDETVRRLQLQEAADDARVMLLWDRVAGPAVAAASRPDRLDRGTLWITVKSSAWSQELSFMRGDLLKQLHREMGKAYPTAIRFQVGTVEATPSQGAQRARASERLERVSLKPALNQAIRESVAGCRDLELADAAGKALTRMAQRHRWVLDHGGKECPECGAAFAGPGAACPGCWASR